MKLTKEMGGLKEEERKPAEDIVIQIKEVFEEYLYSDWVEFYDVVVEGRKKNLSDVLHM